MSYVSNALCGTAFQEAGRAVVARYFGLKVVELEIREDGSGKTDTVGAIDELPLIDRIAIYCAGQASRTVFRCRSHLLAVFGDHTEISKLVEGLADDHSLEVRNAGYRRAIEIVRDNATEVERLASLLIRQRRINGSAIEQGGAAGDRCSTRLPEIVYGAKMASPTLAPCNLDEQIRQANIVVQLRAS